MKNKDIEKLLFDVFKEIEKHGNKMDQATVGLLSVIAALLAEVLKRLPKRKRKKTKAK